MLDDETTQLRDETWWDDLWELLDPVLKARVDAKRARRRNDDVAELARRGLEEHRFSFEGAISQLATHLVVEHAVSTSLVQPHAHSLTEGGWTALDDLHRSAHARESETPAPAPAPALPRTRYRDWGVAWFSRSPEPDLGVCERCRRGTRVYQAYNGGAHMGRFCYPCKAPVLHNEA